MKTLLPDWLAWPEIQTLIAAFRNNNAPLRFVGGAVRDAILARNIIEVDAATPLLPEATIALLEKEGLRAIPTGIKYGTVSALIHNRTIEITTLRRDEKTDGRHAEVSYTDSWQEDATRRDFTMNALYLSPEGEVFDYCGGVADVLAGCVKFIGDADARIKEDYLRILRFFRFQAHYGKVKADENALRACSENASGIGHLSAERMCSEMMKLLAANDVCNVLSLMHEAKILSRVALDYREIPVLEKLENQFPAHSLSPIVKLASLLNDSSAREKLAKRWKLSIAQKNEINDLRKHVAAITLPMSEAQQKYVIRRWGAQHYGDVVRLAFALSGTPWKNFEPLLALQNWQAPDFPITGNDLLKAGLSEGKQLGKALKTLEAAWEASDYTLNKEALLRLV